MKTSLNKHQLLSLGISIGLLLVAAVLGWSGLGSLGEKKAEAQSLADQMEIRRSPHCSVIPAARGGRPGTQKKSGKWMKL